MAEQLTAPFPYFGGKRLVASEVWSRFGDVDNYVEPFAGTAAVLLGRPHFEGNRVETINDANCFISNFWRAVVADPEKVAHYADWPINEADLHARHNWLMFGASADSFRERMKTDPDHYDAKIAGWWVWGQSCWIAGGWCDDGVRDRKLEKRTPHLTCLNGVNAERMTQKMPDVRGGRGVLSLKRCIPNAMTDKWVNTLNARRPDMAPPKGVHKLDQKRPSIQHEKGVNARHVHLGRPYASQDATGLESYMIRLSERLRRVRVVCGNWDRIISPSVTTFHGVTGIFLDPPYSDKAGRDPKLYGHDSLTVAHDVREWCIKNGDNPLFCIALCGYDTEHEMPEGWTVFSWKTQGGYGHIHKENNTKANRLRERIWFSPHCLAAKQGSLI